MDRLRLLTQGVLALAVLGGATFLGSANVIEGESVVALYSVALGAVGAGAVGGIRQQHNGTPAPGTVTTVTTPSVTTEEVSPKGTP